MMIFFFVSLADCNAIVILLQIRDTLDRAVSTYRSLKDCAVRDSCIFCSGDSKDEMFACLKCNDW